MPQARPASTHEQGAQALAAAADDVLGHLVDQRHGALQAGADHGVHRRRGRGRTSARISSRGIGGRVAGTGDRAGRWAAA